MINLNYSTTGIFLQTDESAFEGLSQLVLALVQNPKVLLCSLLALTIGYALGRYRAVRRFEFQNRGEAELTDVLRISFRPPDYYLMNHITLPLRDGTTQIDHILLSRFGVFVIETKNYKGWIFASGKSAYWSQVLFRNKYQFRNPTHQNYGHLLTVQNILDFVPVENVKSAVVFMGDAEFRTEIPDGVYDLSGFVEYLQGQRTEVMSRNRMQMCVGRLETVRLSLTNQTDVEHVQYLRRRFGLDA